MTWLLSLDTGRQGFGWTALYHDEYPNMPGETRLRACGVVPQPKSKRDFEAAALQDVAAKVVAEIRAALSWPPDVVRHGARAVVERMVLYPGQKTYAANDLLDLQAIGSMVAAALVPLPQISYRRPSEWKGSVDTEVIARRLLVPDNHPARRLSPLTDKELELLRAAVARAGKTLGHNIVDAAAMGLVEAGRLRLK